MLTPQASVSGQLLHKYRLDIVGGKYPTGSQFPTVRALAYEESVNPNTMQKVLTTLEQDGLLISQGTRGRFVTEDAAVIAQMRSSPFASSTKFLPICAEKFKPSLADAPAGDTPWNAHGLVSAGS